MRQKLHLTPFTFLVIDFAEPTSYKALCAWIKDVRHHLILFKWGFPEAFIPGSPPCLEYRSNRSSIGNLCDQLLSLSISHLPTTNKHRARLVKGGDRFKIKLQCTKIEFWTVIVCDVVSDQRKSEELSRGWCKWWSYLKACEMKEMRWFHEYKYPATLLTGVRSFHKLIPTNNKIYIYITVQCYSPLKNAPVFFLLLLLN